jgi:hypothetical protein
VFLGEHNDRGAAGEEIGGGVSEDSAETTWTREHVSRFDGAELWDAGVEAHRRTVSITGRLCLEGAPFPDTIAIGGWDLEWHDSTKENWASEFRLPDDGCSEFALGCLWSVDTANIFAAGRCVDGDQYSMLGARCVFWGLRWPRGRLLVWRLG